jgi:hypothetical protein
MNDAQKKSSAPDGQTERQYARLCLGEQMGISVPDMGMAVDGCEVF